MAILSGLDYTVLPVPHGQYNSRAVRLGAPDRMLRLPHKREMVWYNGDMNGTRNILEGKLQPPIGISDWARFSQDSYCVDKTLFIKELVDKKTRVALFTRPRRFGKTSAMEMLRAFFEKTDADTSYLFADKEIWKAGEEYRSLQGKYPVIYLTFKDHKARTWPSAEGKLIRDVAAEVGRHLESVLSDWDTDMRRDQLVRVMKRAASIDEVAESLGYLAEAIHFHRGVKPIILIDEYDMPITSAQTQDYYDEMVVFMRTFLSGAMKDNRHVEMGIMTGVLRVAKEGILSGLNNLRVWTVFEPEFSEYFGFTENEVREMAAYYGVPEKMEEIKVWYDGYNFGGREMYNPWSVLNYFACSCRPKAYWLDTSSNDLITELVRTFPHDVKDVFEKLLRGECVYVAMAEELGPYRDVLGQADTLYALLVSAGYLKVESDIMNGMCAVRIPNHEVAQVFVKDIVRKIKRVLTTESNDIARALIACDAAALQKAIATFLRESVSYFDTAAEGFFHGLTLGFLAMLRDRFRVDSNAESGDERFDIALTPIVDIYPGFIIEVKKADAETDNLDALARTALDQIETKDYAAKMASEFAARSLARPIVKIGLAYSRKNVVLAQACV